MFQTVENSTIKCRVEKAQSKFRQYGLVHTHQKPQSHGWETTMNITFHWKHHSVLYSGQWIATSL